MIYDVCVIGGGASGPVSYTHLDVYKRQVIEGVIRKIEYQ